MQFYSVLVEESKIICSCRRFIQGGYFKKKQFVHRWHQKSGFNLSTLRNRLQRLLLLKFHHTLNIFISFFCGPGALLLRFTLRGQYIPFISVIHPFEFFKKGSVFKGETKQLVLTCLRLETVSNVYYFWSFTMHSISSSNFFSQPWCIFTPFYSKRARYTVHLSNSSLSRF